MKTLVEYKQNKIRIILFTLKILALFFSVVPLYQRVFKGVSINIVSTQDSIIALAVVLFITCIILFLWIIMDRKKRPYFYFVVIEIAIFYFFFITSIFISGSYASSYKFLFLFLVISYTVEFGTRFGLAIASISSAFILGMDILLVKTSGVNEYFENDLALSAMFIVVAWTLGYYVKLEKTHIEQLTTMVNVDGLTQVYNHRYLHDYLKYEYGESVKKGKPLSLLMIDIDYFKKYNDIFGHQRGDEVLKTLAYILTENARTTDVVCRYGGEEFCIVLPNTTKSEALIIANNIRRVISEFNFEGQECLPNKSLTVSVGIAQAESTGHSLQNYLVLINNADNALYRAKFLRKNRVEVFSSVFEQLSDFDVYDKKTADIIKTLQTLISIINSRDKYTYNHVEKVVRYCDIMAKHLHLDRDAHRRLIFGAYMHDLGKINISKDLLITDQPLTDEQWEELKKHVDDGADIINQSEGFKEIIPIVMQHHERYDGTGYPAGLKGEEIDILARIMTLADSFDAMTTYRPYQTEKTIEEAFAEIRACAGTQFDPRLAEEFIKAITEED
jgi:diguanylate cyclase (GGDEF)-like protein